MDLCIWTHLLFKDFQDVLCYTKSLVQNGNHERVLRMFVWAFPESYTMTVM